MPACGKALAQNFYGIMDVRHIEAAGLDIVGADVEAIMAGAEASLSKAAADRTLQTREIDDWQETP